MSADSHIGVTGLAVMGANLARNIAHHGIPVAVHNRTTSKTDEFIAEHGEEGPLTGTESVEEFVAALERPRRVMIMVKAGGPTDAVIDELSGHLERATSSSTAATRTSSTRAGAPRLSSRRGLNFVGAGVSGGEEGALKGPSIMPGGAAGGLRDSGRDLETIAAKVARRHAVLHATSAPNGAGHYVKMVHNGIEYGDMQLICEVLRPAAQALGLSAREMRQDLQRMEHGRAGLVPDRDHRGYAWRKTDPETGAPFVDIARPAGQKGTGKWTAPERARYGRAAADDRRGRLRPLLSALKEERVAAVDASGRPEARRGERKAATSSQASTTRCTASKICSYAQGFQLMAAAHENYKWNLDFGDIARSGAAAASSARDSCRRLPKPTSVNPQLANLLLDPFFSRRRRRGSGQVAAGIPTASNAASRCRRFTSCLSYYDGYRAARRRRHLLQGQRDFFGAHTYARTDREGIFHTRWAQDGTEVRTDA